MNGIVWHGEQDFSFEEIPEPAPGPDQVAVQTGSNTSASTPNIWEVEGWPAPGRRESLLMPATCIRSLRV